MELTRYPLSHQQRDLWVLSHLLPPAQQCALNLCFQLTLRGSIDESALGRAVQDLGRIHPVLRMRLTSEQGDVSQFSSDEDVRMFTSDLSGMPDPAAAAAAIARSEARRAMQLDGGALSSFLLLRVAPDESRLIINVHHVISDGWSMGIIRDDLAALYTARVGTSTAQTPKPVDRYQDFVRMQVAWRATPEFERSGAYWTSELLPPVTDLDLPTDFARPVIPSFRGDSVRFTLGKGLVRACRRTSVRLQVPFSVLLLAAFGTLLADQSCDDEMVIGTCFAGRDIGDRWRRAVGLFVNTVPIVLRRTDHPTYVARIRHVSEKYCRAYDEQRYPIQFMLDKIGGVKILGYPALFRVVFNYQETRSGESWGGLIASSYEQLPTGTSTFELLLHLTRTSDDIVARLDYCSDLFSATSVSRMASQYVRLLEASSDLSRPRTN